MERNIRASRVAKLVDICKELSHARDLAMVMEVVRRSARALTGADGATFVLRERGADGELCHYADEDAIGPLWKGQRFPVTACISGWAMLNKDTAVVPDIATDPRIPYDLYRPTFVRSLVMVPIRREDPLGAIGIYWRNERCPTAEEVAMLQALADITAVTMELVQVYRDLEQRVEARTQDLLAHTRETTSNIEYAKRLQRAMLPPAERMDELLHEHFVVYRPKAIVSGDFYWVTRREDRVLVAVADCTGHGVTGALLSAMCSNQLDRAVNEFGFTDPGTVLDMTRELVWERLARSAEITDGMDVSLCLLDRNAGEVRWAGANIDLLYVADRKLQVVKAHRQAIGLTTGRSPFPTHVFRPPPGTMLYFASDGFVDQFGGPLGRKYMNRSFQQLVLGLHSLPAPQQGELLNTAFEEWRNDREQIDDVTVVGVRF